MFHVCLVPFIEAFLLLPADACPHFGVTEAKFGRRMVKTYEPHWGATPDCGPLNMRLETCLKLPINLGSDSSRHGQSMTDEPTVKHQGTTQLEKSGQSLEDRTTTDSSNRAQRIRHVAFPGLKFNFQLVASESVRLNLVDSLFMRRVWGDA